jgi:para-nitrobenzyl esterase
MAKWQIRLIAFGVITLQAGFFGVPAKSQIVTVAVPGDPVTVDSGRIAGKVLPSGVRAYLGIPFAAPPVRESRWREPQPVAPWQGVYNADRFAPECIQVLRRHNLNHYFGEEPTSEDCLYLNIWAPPLTGTGAKLPVIVFLYGGGFTIGSAGMAMYGGENVARHNAIFVNFNYRIGALGFMAHPELTAESAHHASGNYGLLDQVAALKWIQRNIAQFGGDPGNITITGQSAGASSVAFLQASPLATGLFHRAAAFSGSVFGPAAATPPRVEAEKAGLAVQATLGAKSVAELRLLPADKIVAVQEDCQLGCAGSVKVGPHVDGHFLPDSPAKIFAQGRQNDVPVILALTRDESSNDLRTAGTLEAYRAAATKYYGDRAEKFLTLYPASSDAEAREMGLSAARDGMIGMRMRSWALAQSERGKAPVYIAMFSRVHPFSAGVTFYDNPKAIGAYHTSDVPYWFQTQDTFNLFRTTRDWTDYDRDLSNKMMSALLAFARVGDPSTASVPWPRWSRQKEQLIEFGDAVSIQPMSTQRLDFHTNAGVMPAVPRLSRD